MQRLKCTLVATTMGVGAVMGVPAAAAQLDFSNLTLAPNAESFTLDNGMDVVVIPDRRAPIVTHMVWYRAGAADEPPGKSGIAHYLEHLMFKGTEENPGNTFSAAISRVGGRENAFTSSDYTAYFQQVAVEHLPQMMAFEADRMSNLILNDEVAAPELKVVQEERRSRVETQPSSLLGEAIDATLFINHPYGDPVIGWADEIATLTYEDALDFYRDHYRPSSAVLVIAGDVDVDEVKRLAADTYAKIPDHTPAGPRERPQPQRVRADRTVELRDARVTQPSVQVAFVVPSYTTTEDERDPQALDVLAEILGGSNVSRLYQALVRERGLATATGAYYQSTALDDTRFVIYAVPRDGVSLDEASAAALAVVADIAENGVTEAELERARTGLLSSVIFAQDSQSSLARIFGSALTTGSSVEDVQQWPQRISSVTTDDVQAAAAKFLVGTPSVTGKLRTAAASAAAQ